MGFFKKIAFAFFMMYTIYALRVHRKKIDLAREAKNYEEEQKEILATTIKWGSMVFNHYGITIDVGGESELPQGPVLFVSNHEGYGDIMAFMVAIQTKQFGFVAKEELGKIPVFGKWILRIRSIVISRGDSRETIKTFKLGEEMIKQGFSLVIFPEGTRAKDKGMAPFNKGSLKMALKTKIPIVPVTIKGTWKLFEEKGYPSSGNVKFYIHKAVPTEGLTKEEESRLSEGIEKTVRDKLVEWENE